MPSRHCPSNALASGAFTLWELLCTLAVASILSSIGVPAMQRLVLDARLTGAVADFVGAVQLARSEAIKRGTTVVLCQTEDRFSCATSLDYTQGWIVFAEHDAAEPVQRADTEPLLRVDQPSFTGTILANRSEFEFRPHLKRSTNGTVTFCDRRGAAHARAVVISYTGRARVAGPARSSLRCPQDD